MKEIIRPAKNIREYEMIRNEMIQHWVDTFFVPGSVEWNFNFSPDIIIFDETGEYIIVPFDLICSYFGYFRMVRNDK